MNMFDLSGKVALVTGGTRGIGRAIALTLAQAGADVVATSRREDHVRKVTEEIKGLGRNTLAITTDVTQANDRARMVQETLKEFGRIDIFVSNAGASTVFKKVEYTTEEEWDYLMNLNVKASFFSCIEVGKRMIEQGQGRIIILGSILSHVVTKKLVPYSITKTALLGMTKGLALEWHRFNIRVNCIAPGYVESDLTKEFIKNVPLYEESLQEIPLKRYAKPEEIAKIAVMLASDASDYMVGSTICVDGGYLIH